MARYRVDVVKQELKSRYVDAYKLGMGSEFTQALTDIEADLEEDPETKGWVCHQEFSFEIRAIKKKRIYAVFRVYQAKRLVVIIKIYLAPPPAWAKYSNRQMP